MNPEKYLSFKQVTGFTDDEMSLALRHFKEKDITRKTTVLAAGKVAQEVYFIFEGCMRLFYTKDGLEISAFFFTENMFAGAYDSCTSRQKSRHSIEAIEDSHVLSISYESMQVLYSELPQMNEFVRKTLEARFFVLHELYASLILDTPEQRYKNLLKERPDLLRRIPQHQIATFLGITPVSLSRIRNRVAKK